MAYIEPRRTNDGETRYRVMVRLKGHPTQTATFRRKVDAKRWAQQTETAIRERRYFKTVESQRRTLGQMVERYIAETLPTRNEKDRKLLTSQLRWWAERLGEYALADVSPAMIAEQRDSLANGASLGSRPVSPATQNRYVQALSHAYTVAWREWEWVEENPIKKVRRLKEPRGRVRFLSNEERSRFFEACRNSKEPRLFPLVVLAVGTGARRGEMLALRWSDIDFDRGLAILEHTKNGERRALPLEGPPLEELKSWREVSNRNSDLVFADAKGVASFPRDAWEIALEEAQIEDFRFHDLRHTFASYLAMSGATLAELAEALGHKTLAMVKRYAHLTEAHTRGVVRRMNQAFLS